MGRTEQFLKRRRAELGRNPPASHIAGMAAELEALAGRIPAADAPLAPVLLDLTRMAREATEGAVVERFLTALDAAIAYSSRRDDPARDQLLTTARELAVPAPAGAAAPAQRPAAAAGSDLMPLPASFVGELPPESTLDDAAVLLVQLEPQDRYGAHSLVEILERAAGDDRRPAGERRRLGEAVDLLSTERLTDEVLQEVGSILEGLNGDVGHGMSPAAAPPSPEPEAAIPSDAPITAAWRPAPDTDMDLMREFLVESQDLLASAEEALLALEADPGDAEAINVVFRAFHTIKGTSGFLGLDQSERLCHHAESLLSRVRDGGITLSGSVADASLKAVDVLGALLTEVGVALDGDDPDEVRGLAPLVQRLEALEAGRDESTDEATSSGGGQSSRQGSTAAPRGDSSVRVRTDRLDGLVDLVGELVIAQSMIAQDDRVQDSAQRDLAKKVAHAGKIVRELQDLSMALRMVPLRSTFSKLQRLVRDLARKSGKRVQLFMEGEDTEIDRTMVDILGDPLVHMVRNAMDHGIELPADRVGAGKPEVGSLWVRASHAGGNVVVELEDDGRGMSRARIVAKAVERGLVRSGDGLTDQEVWKLVFEPGFSTAEKVTDVSGRGVGMDVVRRNIETLRGRIEVESEEGSGTKVTLRLPLTLAITEGMLMRVGKERYVIPTLSIERNIRPTADMLPTVVGRGEMLLLREELLPVVRLGELFGIEGARGSLEEGLLVVIGAAERRCALFVDELLGQQQVVVKSLGEGLGKLAGVTGGAVLGDGTVGLILDALELVNLARKRATASRAA
jgi:two-component system, chemotaxis family, sensor kinase CheA